MQVCLILWRLGLVAGATAKVNNGHQISVLVLAALYTRSMTLTLIGNIKLELSPNTPSHSLLVIVQHEITTLLPSLLVAQNSANKHGYANTIT